MKKSILLIILSAGFSLYASAQVKFEAGIKGGVNLSQFSTDGTFSSSNRAGYLGGLWTRISILGLCIQPEAYYTSKTATLGYANGNAVTEKFNSIDVPVLFGYKIGLAGIDARLQTGPMASFILNNSQSFSQATGNIVGLNFKNQAYAWQFGTGVDVKKISVDLRYELGLTNLNNDGYNQKLNLFNLSLGLKF